MKSVLALAFAGAAAAQLAAAPNGFQKSYSGNFEITIVTPSNAQAPSAGTASNCGQAGILTLNLNNGDLMDIDGRTGYIASNNSQFQFDKPVQAGGIYQGQFSLGPNGSLALGPTTTFYQCQSGGFYNLYYSSVAPQCSPVNIDIIPCAGNGTSTSAAAATAASTAAAVSVSKDGQPQGTAAASSVVPVSMKSDGQPQATAAATSVAPAPVSVYTDGQPQATVAATTRANITVASATASAKPIATGAASAVGVPAVLAGVCALFALL